MTDHRSDKSLLRFIPLGPLSGCEHILCNIHIIMNSTDTLLRDTLAVKEYLMMFLFIAFRKSKANGLLHYKDQDTRLLLKENAQKEVQRNTSRGLIIQNGLSPNHCGSMSLGRAIFEVIHHHSFSNKEGNPHWTHLKCQILIHHLINPFYTA